MAYYPPRFNVWCFVKRYNETTGLFVPVGYSKCQLRGPDSKEDSTSLLISNVQVLFPKGTDVRSPAVNASGVGDRIYVAGQGRHRLEVRGVGDKGAGFGNEYRLANCWYGSEATEYPYTLYGLPPVNIGLLPPDGFTPVPILETRDAWYTG